MPRQATGSIETHHWRDGRTVTFRARFRAYGRRWRIDFGTNQEGWNDERARVELERIMGQVARGTWEPPAPEAPADFDRDETLPVTASRCWQRRESELGEHETRLPVASRSRAATPRAHADGRDRRPACGRLPPEAPRARARAGL